MCIVVGEFGEEESAHSDNGANQKEEEKKRERERVQWKRKLGWSVGWAGLVQHKYTHTYKSIQERRGASSWRWLSPHRPTALHFFGRRSSSFLILILSRDDIDIEIENIDRQKKRKKEREEQEEEEKITHKWEE